MIVPGSANALMLGQQSSGYNLTKSLRFRSSASAYLNRTFGTPTNANVWTYSVWLKRGALGGYATLIGNLNTTYPIYQFLTSDKFGVYDSGSANTTPVYRDPSSWYHFLIQRTSSTVVNLYVNGLLVQTFTSQTNAFNTSGSTYTIGRSQSGEYFDGYMAEVNFIDGQALTPSSFGSTNATTGVWQPAKYTGTYGTNGFYLPFTDVATTSGSNAGLGKDFSGNGNYWTTNNISVTSGSTYDSMTDVPTLTSATAANYAVLNPLSKGSDVSITNGNLTYSLTGSTNCNMYSSIGMTSGKFYCEVSITGNQYSLVGISDANVPAGNGFYQQSTGYGYYGSNGNKYNSGSGASYGATFTAGDVIGIAFDADARTLTFYKNGTSQGTAYTSIPAGTYYFCEGNVSSSPQGSFNFGQQPFAYTPPTGYVALNTYNLAAGTVTTSGSFTGNGSTDGPFVYLNGVPTAMTINGNSVTFGTNADKLANGFKVRSSSSSYNNSGVSNSYTISTTGATFKYANAQGNP